MNSPSIRVTLLFACLMPAASFALAADAAHDWPQWLGPNRDGVTAEPVANADWAKNPPATLWSAKIGAGYGAATVVGDRLYISGNVKIDGKDSDVVYCLAADTGKELWRFSYPCPPAGKGYPGPRTSAAVANGLLFTQSIQGQLFCLNADTGKLVWSKDLVAELNTKAPTWGFAGSPLLSGKNIIVDVGVIAALDQATGKILWKSQPYKHAYSSPVEFKQGGKTFFASFVAAGLVVVDSAGREVALVPWKTNYDINAATPLVTAEGIFISSGYGVGGGLFAFDGSALKEVWKSKSLGGQFTNALLKDGFLYGADGNVNAPARASLKCLDLKTGQQKWSTPGFGSPLLSADKLVVLYIDGKLTLVAANPGQYQELGSTQLPKATWWTMPILSNGRLFCRSHEGDLICLDLRAK